MNIVPSSISYYAIFQNGGRKFCKDRVFSFSQLFCFICFICCSLCNNQLQSQIYEIFEILEILWTFGKQILNMFFFRNSRFPVRSVFVINVSLFTSVVCYYQNGLRRKHGQCSLCNKWWNSFMNQRLNHLVLYKKCNCIRNMSLNTYYKKVDIIQL